MRFRLVEVGPGESPHDSWWILENDGHPRVFSGDLVYNHMHGYLADGYYDAWLANLDRASSDLPAEATFYMGHGSPGSGTLMEWQQGYTRTFLDAVRETLDGDVETATRRVTDVMQAYLPATDLLFLMQLSVPPVRESLAQA